MWPACWLGAVDLVGFWLAPLGRWATMPVVDALTTSQEKAVALLTEAVADLVKVCTQRIGHIGGNRSYPGRKTRGVGPAVTNRAWREGRRSDESRPPLITPVLTAHRIMQRCRRSAPSIRM